MLLRALVVCAVALPGYSALQGYDVVHAAAHSLPLVAFAILASASALGPRARAAWCAAGLLSAAALFVHSAHGLTEAHFAFFVVIICLTLYEDWLPFLIAVALVVIHHGVLGMIDPGEVYSGESLTGSPWKWAAVHGAFVTAAGSAAIVVWRFNEKLRQEKEVLVARLGVLAREDQLTGLPNRRGWDERLAEEMSRAKRSTTILTVALLDLDDLKGVNDVHGHEAGDRLLRSAAAAWSGALRDTDFIARLGGDEFGVILPAADAAAAAHTVRRMLDAMPSGHGFSAGIASWDRQEESRALLSRADIALYEAKAGGGRRLRTVPAHA